MDTMEKAPRRRRTKLVAGATAVVLAGSLGAAALFENAGAAPGDNAQYNISLTAAAQVPPSTDTRTAAAIVQVKGKKARVCVLIKQMGPNAKPVPPGDVPIAAHIHGPAVAGVNAAILIPLNTPVLKGKKYDKSKTCVDNVDPALITQLKTNPQNYYVNVHTVDFPGGAIRGQLAP